MTTTTSRRSPPDSKRAVDCSMDRTHHRAYRPRRHRFGTSHNAKGRQDDGKKPATLLHSLLPTTLSAGSWRYQQALLLLLPPPLLLLLIRIHFLSSSSSSSSTVQRLDPGRLGRPILLTHALTAAAGVSHQFPYSGVGRIKGACCRPCDGTFRTKALRLL
jgi:hypothetical protein